MNDILQPTSIASWTTFQKIAFRFCFLFFGLMIFPFPLDWFSFMGSAFDWFFNSWNWLVVFTGKNILHLSSPITVQPNGSGDTTWNYVQIFIITVLSITGCLVWSILDKNRKNYTRLFYWFNVAIRYYLAFSMFSYGFIKIFKLQFPYPSISRLVEPYGQSTPMGLAWTFLGYSKGYNYFMGAAEVIGGVLLLSRRTTTFGALFCMTVTANIMAINYSFDVPVKIYSTTLFAMSVYLAAPEIKKLIRFFFYGTKDSLTAVRQPLTKKWQRVTAFWLKMVLIIYFVGTMISGDLDDLSDYGDAAPKAPLYGYYNVETFKKNNDTIAPLLTDTLRWNKIIFDGYTSFNRAIVKKMNDSLVSYTYKIDSLHKSITFTLRNDTIPKDSFFYAFQGNNNEWIELRSQRADSLYMRIHKIYLQNFPLVKRGYHWINEYPLNR
jgi:uncharacterized membrane protein YphA (DoxX/SURF4 family)